MSNEIALTKEKQKEQLKINRFEEIWSQARNFTEEKLMEVKSFNCGDVYQAIGKTRTWVVGNSLKLKEWIQEQVKLSKQQQLEIKINAYKIQIKSTIKQLIEEDVSLSKANIAKFSEVSLYEFAKYPELSLFCTSVIEEKED